MASRATLDGLPVEIIEAIVTQLDLHGICCLRSTGLKIAAKASQGSFKVHFMSKSIKLSEGKLNDFVKLTQRDGLGCLLQNLTLIAHVPLLDELVGHLNQEHELRLLSTALANIRTKSAHGSLRSLTHAEGWCTLRRDSSKPTRSAKDSHLADC